MLPYIELFGKAFPMYGLCIVAGILAAALFMIYDCKKNNVRWENAVIIGLIGVLTGFLGAKILYIFVTYEFSEIVEMVTEWSFDDLTTSGFVFYGGLIAGVAGAFIGAKIIREKLFDYENVLVKIIPLVHGFGRIGCFCAGCCYGKPTDGPLHVIYKHPVSDAPVGEPLMPVQLYEAGFNFILFRVLWFLDRRFKTKLLLPVYIMGYGIERFIIEYFRYDEVRGRFLAFSTSQWISILMFFTTLIFLFTKRQDLNSQE